MRRLATVAMALVLLATMAGPVSAGRAVPVAPDVAEINYFQLAECENVFYWQTDSEINIWAFRIEHPASGWMSPRMDAANYPSIHGMTYNVLGPTDADRAGDFWLRVYFDNGTNRMEDVAERGCGWVPAPEVRR